ncbi:MULTISPECIES: glycosyltransferase [Enterobacterales]|uniref:glycosyltransferase n=1 Tax=Enterobacterales TaxID=91347 RepID=UPI002ED8F102
MSITIAIIVTYKRKELLKKVLEGVFTQDSPVSEIIVIDNNSKDGTDLLVAEMQRSSANAKLSYYNTGDNLGGAGGFAYGFNVVKDKEYDFLWLMDDDLLAEPDCLRYLLDANNDGITQPMRFNLDDTCAEISPVDYDLDTIFLLNPKKSTVKDLYEVQPFTSPISIAGVPFEGPLISKKVVDSIGIPESKFFIFNDDLDYSLRARHSGYKIICEPKARAVRLLVNNQSNDLRSWKGYFMLRNHFYILRCHGKSIFVRARPLFLTLGYFFLSIFRGQPNVAITTLKAYRDSFSLKNNEKYRP